MSYQEWFESHAQKHQEIIQKLQERHYSDEKIIAYFQFDNMVKSEPDFCPLYKEAKKCHEITYLSCYLCACPHFRFNDQGLHVNEKNEHVKSLCAINSKQSEQFAYENVVHLDCSRCIVPHTKAYVRKHFDKSWTKIMTHCQESDKL